MLQSYTPLSQLTPQELAEARQRAPFLTESSGAMVLSTGRAVSVAEARQLAPTQQRQNLFG